MFIYLILMRQPFTVLKDEQFNSISWYSFSPLLPSYVELECVHITIWCGGVVRRSGRIEVSRLKFLFGLCH